MSAVTTFIQASGSLVSAVSVAQLARGLLSLSLFSGFVMFFRPLLVGIARALMLTVRPRRPKTILRDTPSGA